MQNDARAPSQSRLLGRSDGEGPPRLGGPGVGPVLVVLGDHLDLVGDEVGRVESHAELSDHGNVGASGEGLHEGLGARFGDGAEVVHEVGLGHADAAVFDGQRVVGLVGDELDLQLGLRIEDGRIGEGLIADFIEGIGGVGDQFSEENFLVGVESVDNEGEELVDVCREGVGFCFGHG